MKNIQILVLAFVLITLASFKITERESSFDFKNKKIESNVIEARFQLTKSINFTEVKNVLMTKTKLKGFVELNKEENYYAIQYYSNSSLNDIRNVFLSVNSDIDKDYIIITHKSFYNN